MPHKFPLLWNSLPPPLCTHRILQILLIYLYSYLSHLQATLLHKPVDLSGAEVNSYLYRSCQCPGWHLPGEGFRKWYHWLNVTEAAMCIGVTSGGSEFKRQDSNPENIITSMTCRELCTASVTGRIMALEDVHIKSSESVKMLRTWLREIKTAGGIKVAYQPTLTKEEYPGLSRWSSVITRVLKSYRTRQKRDQNDAMWGHNPPGPQKA